MQPMEVPGTDSQKIRLIPQIMQGMAQLNELIVTGNLKSGEPGLLESVREIKKDLHEIKQQKENVMEFERRIKEIEERHKRIDEQKKRFDTYQVMIIGLIITNIINMIMGWMGLK